MIIDLPWPHKSLSPNARVHWAEKARAVKRHRELAQWKSAAFDIDPDVAEMHVTVTAYPPTRAAFDDDNFMARCKAYLDGIADSLEINDSKFRIQPLQRGEIVKGGTVRFEIEVPQ